MKRTGITIAFASLLPIASLAQTPSPPPKATITGVVVRAGTNDPLAGAKVTLLKVQDASSAQPKGDAPIPEQLLTAIPSATTDAQGRFQITDIAAGTYQIVAARNGFAKQAYGQRSFNRPGTNLNIAAGQRLQDIVFRLTPAPTISGRIIDSSGEPLAGIAVQALRSTYDATGKRKLEPAQSTKTNDLGEYRLYWLNPGRYFVSANAVKSALDTLSQATAQAQPIQARELTFALGADAPENQVTDSGFGLTYYPGTPDASRAAALDLRSGELRADFVLSRSQRSRIRGRLIDATTGRPPKNGSVSAMPKNDAQSSVFDLMLGGMAGALQGNKYDPATGEFEVRDVVAGSYKLVASDGFLPGAGSSRVEMPIEVSGADIDNVALTLTPGITIRGRVRIEGDSPVDEKIAARIGLLLQPAEGGSLMAALVGGISIARPLTDGTFTMNRITPGEYKLVVMEMPPNMFIKDARLGRLDVLESVSISDRVDGSLDVTLSTSSGELSGTVMDKSGRPVAGNPTVVLVPDRLRERTDLYKTTDTSSDGHFTIHGITPGNYRIFAWEDIEPFSYFDPEVLKSYENQGKPIRVDENSKGMIEVTVIP